MRSWSLARRVLVVQWIALAVLTVAAAAATYWQTRAVVHERTADAAVQVATVVADDPRVAAAFAAPDPSRALQPLADRVMADTEMDFSTFIARDASRLTYHRAGLVGTPYTGTLAPVWKGEVVTETSSTATAGRSVRAVVPVRAADGAQRVVGALTVGRQVTDLDVIAASSLSTVLSASLLFALVLGLGSWWGSRYLSRATAGLGPEALSRRFEVADTALLSVDEGIVMADHRGRIVFHNRAADDLLRLPGGEDPAPDPLPDGEGIASHLGETLADLISSGRLVEDESHRVGGRVVIVSQRPLQRRGGRPGSGTVLTVHDHTAVQALSGELASTRSLTDALRAQNHDHANRLHTLLSLLEVERSDEAAALLRESLGSARTHAGVGGADADTVLVALVHGKIAEAAERGISLDTDLRLDSRTALPAADLVAIFGNLIDNALDAAQERGAAEDRWVRLEVRVEPSEDGQAWLVASVADGGPGPDAATRERMFEPGFSTKPAGVLGRGQGLAIVAGTVHRLGGHLEVATDSGTVFTVELPLPQRGGADG